MQTVEDIGHVNIRLELRGPTLRKIEDWRKAHNVIPSRSEAVRRLLDQALSTTVKQPAA
jgi:hypothetical protein